MESISLRLALSKPRLVQWMKGTETIRADDERLVATTSESQLEHMLTISSSSLSDSGSIFTASISDLEYGTVTSSCTVTVKGMALPKQLIASNLVWSNLDSLIRLLYSGIYSGNYIKLYFLLCYILV